MFCSRRLRRSLAISCLQSGAILTVLFTHYAKLGWAEGAAILGLSLLNYALRFVRWQWYLSRLGHAIPAPQRALIYLAGFALTTTPGKAGEAGRGIGENSTVAVRCRHIAEGQDIVRRIVVESCRLGCRGCGLLPDPAFYGVARLGGCRSCNL